MNNNNHLSAYIHNFHGHLKLNGFSQHTIWSYRDTIKLLLDFCADQNKKSANDLTLNDLTPERVVNFLDYLEKTRNNSIQTRNIRLGCIHSLFTYMGNQDPWIFNQCYKITTIPFKRAPENDTIDYLEVDEMKAVLKTIDCNNPDGYRDYTLLTFMYNTGARVEEIIKLPVKAIKLERPFEAKILGKGDKERLCPLWPETAKLLGSLIKQRELDPQADVPIFVNHKGQHLTRNGVRYLLNKYVKIATKDCPSLKQKRIHPHCIRHSCAMALVEAKVDINTIRAWLGHVSLETTNRYAKINLKMKREVLEKYVSISKVKRPWKENGDLMQWLKAL